MRSVVRRAGVAAAAVTGVVWVGDVRAQEGPTTAPAVTRLPEAEVTTDRSGRRVDEVVVRGRAGDLTGVAKTANEGYVGREELGRRPILRPTEVMEAVPGLAVTQHSGGGKANQYFLRGFQLDHGTDFAVTLEGVPQNMPSHGHGQGYLDLNYLIPELIDNVRYRKGPYFADVGDFSAAGSADITYVDSLDRGIYHVEGGMFGYGRGLVANSFRVGEGNLLYALEYIHNDGPWESADSLDRINGVLKYSGGNADDGWSVTGLGYHAEWSATDQIPQRAESAGLLSRFGIVDDTDGGGTQHYTVVAEGHHQGPDSADSLMGFVRYYDLNLFSNFTYFLEDPVRGDQFEQLDRRVVSGLRGAHEWDTPIFGKDGRSTVGIQVRNDLISNGLYRSQARQRFATVREDEIVQTSLGVFVENRTQWLPKMRTEVGARGDVFNFDVDSRVDDRNSGNETAAVFSPKGSVVFGPWKKTEYYVSAGYGFHSNDARGITTTMSPSTLVPTTEATPLVRGKGAEVGVRTGIIPRLQSTVSLWALNLDSELVFEGDTAEVVPGDGSERYGVELANFYRVSDWMTLDLDYSISQAKFEDSDDYVPESIRDVLEAGVTVQDIPGLRGWFGSMRLRYFGPRPLIESGNVESNLSAIVNAQVGYRFDDVWTVRVDFLNLFDIKTDDIQYFYTSRLQGEPAGGREDIHFHPAEPFQVRVGVTARF